jgi:hypothetical protein
MVTTAGLGWITGLVVGVSTKLQLGTGTTAVTASDATLTTPITDSGLTISASTNVQATTTVANDTAKFSYTWSSITGSKTLAEYGLWDSGQTTLYTHKLLSPTRAVLAGDTYTLNHQVRLS